MAKSKTSKSKKAPAVPAEDSLVLDSVKGDTTITDMATGEVVSAPPSSIPGKPMDEDAPTPSVRLGKKFKGEKFVTVTTSEMVEADTKLQQQYAAPNAVTLTAYFVHKQIRNPVQQASMAAYTRVRRATVQAFDEIFAKF